MSRELAFKLKLTTTGAFSQAFDKLKEIGKKMVPNRPTFTIPKPPPVPTAPKMPTFPQAVSPAQAIPANSKTPPHLPIDKLAEYIQKSTSKGGNQESEPFFKRFKTFGKDLKTETNNLFSGLKNAKGLGDAKTAFSTFGKNIGSACLKLGKFGGLIGLAVAALTALEAAALKFAKDAEKATFQMNRAFKTGGKMAGQTTDDYTDKYSWLEDEAMNGRVNRTEHIKAMGAARMQFQSLDKKTYDKMAQQSIDLGAHLGIGSDEAMMRYGAVLDSLNVTFEDGKNIGLSLTREEINRINALKSAGKQAEANAIIMKRVDETAGGAMDEFRKTMTGMIDTIKNNFSNGLANLGKAIVPFGKLFLWVAKNISIAFNVITKIIADFVEECKSWVSKKAWSNWWNGEEPKKDTENEQKRKEAEKYIDPRLKLTVNFEDATSMVSRIQKSIMEQNSPQVKQVELLKMVNRHLEYMAGESRRQRDSTERSEGELRSVRKNTGNLKLGFQGG